MYKEKELEHERISVPLIDYELKKCIKEKD
jgi:hypothetical protein